MRYRRLAILGFITTILIVVSSTSLLYYRDNFSTHYPVREVAATIFSSGVIPLWNPMVGGGQPLAGNPNSLTFHPSTALYLILPPWVAFNLHFLIHLALAFPAMRALLLSFDIPRSHATIGGAFYVLSGVAVSSLCIAPPAATLPLIPLAWLLAHRLTRAVSVRTVLQLGAVIGLLGIIGAPWAIVTVGTGCVVLTMGRRDRKFYAAAALAFGVGVAIASPMLIAWAEISSQVERSASVFSPETVFAASLSWERLVEMVIGPWRGLPTDLGASGFFASNPGAKWPPFFLSVFVGPMLLPALFSKSSPDVGRHRILFLIFLFLAIGPSNPIIRGIVESFESARFMRYPEKFAVPMTVSGIVLIAAYLSGAPRRPDRAAAILGIVTLVAGGLVVLAAPFGMSMPNRLRLGAGCAVAIAILVCAALRNHGTRFEAMAIGLTFALLLFWSFRALPIDGLRWYRQPSVIAARVDGERVYRAPLANIPIPFSDARERYRMAAQAIDPVFGAVYGARYVLDRSPDGMYSFLTRVASERLAGVDLPTRLRYLRIHGCRYWITRERIVDPGVRLERTYPVGPVDIHLYEILDTLSMVHAPTRSVPGRYLQDVVGLIEESGFDEATTVVTPGNRAARELPRASVSNLDETFEVIRFDVTATSDTVVVINQSYFDAWDVRADGTPLSIFPANLDRLGVEIPAGHWTIEARFGTRRKETGAAWIVSWALLLLIGAWSFLPVMRRNQTADSS